MLLLRANTLALGHSGCRPLIVDRLLDFLGRGIHPVVPEHGSVGASAGRSRTAEGIGWPARMEDRSDSAPRDLVSRMAAGSLFPSRSPEVSMRATTVNPLHGRTRNPWHPDASPGGSSGGAGRPLEEAPPVACSSEMSSLRSRECGGASVRLELISLAVSMSIGSVKPAISTSSRG